LINTATTFLLITFPVLLNLYSIVAIIGKVDLTNQIDLKYLTFKTNFQLMQLMN